MSDENRLVLPTVALRGVTIIPTRLMKIELSRKRSVEAVKSALEEGKEIFLVSQKDPSVEEPWFTDLEGIGVVAKVERFSERPVNDIWTAYINAGRRAKNCSMMTMDPFLSMEVELIENPEPDDTYAAMNEVLLEHLKEYLEKVKRVNNLQSLFRLEQEGLPENLDLIMERTDTDQRTRQEYLNQLAVSARFDYVIRWLDRQIKTVSYRQEINDRVRKNVDQNQKEYYMREQMKVLSEELGEDTASEVEEYLAQTDALEASEEIKEKIRKEIKRYGKMHPSSQDANVLRLYIEAMLEMPWDKATEETIDLIRSSEILERDHYGLKKVKERVLEYLAVRKLNPDNDGPIMCLVGPPGTGKTSIARSVAEALGRKYIRICLGGVRDEAEIRGHRKTYVGAMYGRLAAAIHQAGVCNPVLLLDEIDKVGNDSLHGDPAAALLEVLDPAQNGAFRDHYLEVPLNLSRVLFIATANDVSSIPRPLLDRMEFIEIAGYSDNEKFHIARDFLVPRQLAKNGLDPDIITFEDGSLDRMITSYTKEAGVRNLERTVGEVCRKAARSIVEEKQDHFVITADNLEDYLGKEKYRQDKVDLSVAGHVGLVRGLAWTSVGGVTLEIEVNVMPGKGAMILTGKMGDVMQESAKIACTYVRSIGADYGISDDFFEKHDLHIHIPEGATPKDGPSAGITMTTAILSAVTGIPVRTDIAMTGEVTLRGRVLAIGGLKEKLLAAQKAGVSRVLVPEENTADVAELDPEIIGKMEISFVSHMSQVLEAALLRPEAVPGREGESAVFHQ